MVQSEYSNLLSRHTAMTLRLFLIAALPLLAAGASFAKTPKIREAGNYIMLLDSDEKPVAGAYWLSPDLKVAVTVAKHRGYPSEPIYVDREFMPQRRGVVLSFVNNRITYTPDPLSVDVGEEAKIVRRNQTMGLFANQTPQETPMKLTVTGLVATKISGFKLMSRLYRIEKDGPLDENEKISPWGDRVYVETLDMDLSAEIARLVTSVETGTALSSGDFYIRYMIKADVLPDQTKCLKEKQALETYEAMALRQREGSDKMMATSFVRDGTVFWETGDDFPADAKAMNIYELCRR